MGRDSSDYNLPSSGPLPKINWLDRIAWFYATGGGIGHCPFAPGTVGSLLGPAFIYVWQIYDRPWIEGFVVSIAAILIGVMAADREAKRRHCEDPGHVICDEILAFTIVLGGLNITQGWETALLGFVFFRIFDIWKPWPIRRLERLPGGWGIMADDLLAGVFARIAIHATSFLWTTNWSV